MIKNSTTRLGTAIILPTDVGDFWDSLHKSSFYTRQPWYDRAWDRTSVMSEYRTIMSILIKSGFKRWKYFKKVFIDKENRKDKNLPFSKDEIQKPDFLDVLWREFYVTQWLFCPLKIVEDSDPVELNGDEEERRFPFIKPEKEIGSGAAGTVYKQVIAPGHIKYRSQGRESSNEQEKAVACKRVQQKQMEDVEFENLRTLKDFLSEHTRIMINIATIIRNEQNVGKVHYIFYDLAAYSLKTFLKQAEGIDAKERHENDHGRRSESAPPERNGSHDWKESDLVKESYLLADALAFLHEGLYKETRYTLAHNDLKPENILVFYPNSKKIEERFPVGQWKIADFGLAKIKAQCEPTRIKRNSNRQNLTPEPQRGMGTVADIDLTHRRVRSASGASFRSDDMTKSKQDPGRYSAPEIEGIGEAQPDARKADIWAFGCVLAEVLAFGVNPSLVDELRKECELPEHLDQRFYDMTTNETKPTVRNWLKELDSKCESRRFRKEWIKKCANLICDNILVRDPRGRSSAKEIRTRLESIYEEMVKQMRHMPERDPRRLHLHGEPSPSSPFSDRSEPLESPTRVEDPPMLSILLPGQ